VKIDMRRLQQNARRAEVRAQLHLSKLSSWLKEPDVETPWRIDGWVPSSSRVLFSAQAKAGKTTVTSNLIRSLVDGSPFLGDAAATVSPLVAGETVVLLDFEMSPRQLKDWYRKQEIVNQEAVLVASMRGYASGFDLRDVSIRKKLGKALRELSCKVLILDCLRPILDALVMDEKSESGRFLEALDALIVEARIDVLWLVHHWGHEKERPRGDSRLRDWPDVEISLTCDDLCICPRCAAPLYYAPAFDEHACTDPACAWRELPTEQWARSRSWTDHFRAVGHTARREAAGGKQWGSTQLRPGPAHTV
jgi:hypothetical protein